MSDQTSSECPEPGVLVQFLQGKLQPPQLARCESHLKDCPLCHETLAGLDSDDTLTERLLDVLQQDNSAILDKGSVETPKESAAIQNLLDRLTSDDFKRSAMAAGPEGGQQGRTAQMEIVADRAAEILRCVGPDEDSLGILGDYKLIRLIGAGSTGVVFQALDQPLNRTVALKVLRPSLGEAARTRFLTEARLAASIEHANVVTIFQVGQIDRLAFMAMQWLPGQTLDALLTSGEELDDEKIVEIIRQVATGLNAAHQKRLVHRDIKPANLWICEEGQQLKLLDFGLARINDGDHNLTATGMLAGTPGFMSPEQTRGLELDGRSDLFSLGCVMYRLLSGQLPFDEPSILATLRSIQSNHPAAPAQIDSKANQDLSDITMCLLEKQPANRPQSATQVIELLTKPREQWSLTVPTYANSLAHHTANGRRQTVTKPVKGSGRRWPKWISAFIGLLMLGIGLLMLGVLGWFYAPQIIHIATDQGEVVIKTSDENVEVQVLQDGEVVKVIDTKTQQSFSLKSGQYSFNAVARDPNKDNGNSFTIEPKTLTMKRGEKSIVSVTVKPKTDTDSQIASFVKNELVIKKKPVYEGNTFDQWSRILGSNRDYKAQSNALEACLAIMETKQEQKQILDGVSVFMKTLDREFGYTAFSKNSLDSYQDWRRKKLASVEKREVAFVHFDDLLSRVINSCDQSLVFDFFKSEMEGETQLSHQVLWNWIRSSSSNDVFQRYTELSDTFAENFDKPLVRSIAEYLIPSAAARKDDKLTRFQGSALGEKVKEIVRTGTPEQRIKVLQLAFGIFPDDQQVLLAYQEDLLNPELKQLIVNLDKGGPTEEAATTILFKFMKKQVANKSYYGSLAVNAATRQLRLATAADWLGKVVDSYFAVGDQRVNFGSSVGSSGGRRFYETLEPSSMTKQLLQRFYEVGTSINDLKIKQRLLTKLETLQDAIINGEDKKNLTDREKEQKPHLLADLDYVIAVYQGNTPAELPPEAWLKISADPKDASVLKNEPAIKNEPVTSTKPVRKDSTEAFEGKTLTQWLKDLESDQDALKQAKALKTITAFFASNRRNKELDAMLQKFLSQRASLTSFDEDDDEYIRFLGFAEALGKLSPARTVGFLELQLKEGNEIPLQWTVHGLFERRDIRSSRELKKKLESEAGKLLALISKRKKDGSVNYLFEFIVKRVLKKPFSVDSLDAIKGVLVTLRPLELLKAIEFVPEHVVTADLFVSTKTKLLAKETSVKERDELIDALMGLEDDNIYRKTEVPVNDVYAALLVNQLFDPTPIEFDKFQKMKIYTKKKPDGVLYRSIEASWTTPSGFNEIEIKDPSVVTRKLLSKICERLQDKKQKNPQAAAAKIYAKIANASSNVEEVPTNHSELFKVLKIEQDLEALKKLANKQHAEFSEFTGRWMKKKF